MIKLFIFESTPKSHILKLLKPDRFSIIQTISNLAMLFFIETNLSGVSGVVSDFENLKNPFSNIFTHTILSKLNKKIIFVFQNTH